MYDPIIDRQNKMRPVKKNIITIIEVHPGTVICKIKCSTKDFIRYIRLTAQRSRDIQVINRIGAAEKLSIASMDKPAILINGYLVVPAYLTSRSY
jgi:hypothetical protein